MPSPWQPEWANPDECPYEVWSVDGGEEINGKRLGGYEPCGLPPMHVGQCRTKRYVDARNARRRAKYKKLVEFHGGTVRPYGQGRKW